MSVATRAALAILLCSAGIVACFKAADANNNSGITRQVCEEVAHELTNAYVEGLISERDAQRVIDNCFEATLND